MSLNSLGMGFAFTAVDLASGVMANLRKNFIGLETAAGQSTGNVDKMISKVAAGLTSGFVAAGAAIGTYKLAKKYAEVEASLAQVEIVTHGTVEEMKALEGFALNAAKKLGVMPLEAIEGMQQLGQQGYKVAEIMEMLPQLMKFAAAGHISIAQSTDIASQSMKAFELHLEDMPIALDQIVKAADTFTMEVSDLQIGLARASGGAGLFKASLTDTLTLFGLVKEILHSTELSGTAVSIIFERLANPKYNRFLEAKGIKLIDPQTQRYRSTLDVMTDLLTMLDKMSEPDQGALITRVFGSHGVKGMNALLSQFRLGVKTADGTIVRGADALKARMEDIAIAEGTVERASKIALATFEGSANRAKASWESLVIKIGKPFKTAWQPQLDKLSDFLDKLGDKIDKMDEGKLNRIANGVIVAAGALGTLAATSLVGAIWPMLTRGVVLIGGALGSMVEVIVGIFTGMFGWILIPIIVAIGAAVFAVKKNLGGMGDAWDRLVARFGGFGNAIGGVTTYLSGLWDAFSEGFSEIMNDPFFTSTWTALADSIDMIQRSIGEIFGGMTELGTPGETMKAIFVFIGKTVASIVMFVARMGVVMIRVVAWFMMLIAIVKPFLVWVWEIFENIGKALLRHGPLMQIMKLFGKKPLAEPTEEEKKKPTAQDALLGKMLYLTKPEERINRLPDADAPHGDFPTKPDKPTPATSPFEGVQQRPTENYGALASAIADGFRKSQLTVSLDGRAIIGYLEEQRSGRRAG